MQIRPGVSLLQAIAKAVESRPVPFADRLADLEGGGAVRKAVAAAASSQPATAAAATPAPPVPPPQAGAGKPGQSQHPVTPRGSVLDIIV